MGNRFYRYKDRIVEVRDIDKTTTTTEEELYAQHQIIVKRFTSLEDAENAAQKLKKVHPELGFEAFFLTDDVSFVYSVRPNVSEDVQDVKQMIVLHETQPGFNVIEYDKNGAEIARMEGVHAPDEHVLLQSMEIMTAKSFCDNTDISHAANRDNHRKPLDSVIAKAQREFMDDQIRQKQAAAARKGGK